MNTKNCALGIDIGTSSVKVIALADDGSLIKQLGQRLDLLQPEEGAAEQNLNDIYQALQTVLATLVSDLKKEAWHISHVGFSAAMHSIAVIDENAQPLSNAITWMDTRASESATRLWDSANGSQIYGRTGTPVHPMTPLSKLNHWSKTNPTLLARAHKFVSIKEWIWYQWFAQWVVDVSMAGATGLYNLESKAWDEEALAFAGIEASQLSTIVSTSYLQAGAKSQVLLDLGFDADTLFNVGSTDGVLANLGVGAIEPGTYVLTIGTSSAVRATGNKPLTDAGTRSFCYELDDSHYVLGGPSNAGGISVETLFSQVLAGIGIDWSAEALSQALEAAGEVEIGSLLCLPYVAGERAPLWAPEAKAAWIGMDRSHHGVHLLRAVVEGVLLNAYWIASSLIELTGVPKCVMASGKLLELAWVRQLTADIFAVPVYESESGDASAVGAVMLAQKAANSAVIRSGQMHCKDSMPCSMPNALKHAEYQSKFERFQDIAKFLNT